ncbi:Hypothetical predicted protein [Cloeon dipterum]|uniref:Uncharacterized protein n=2 Tax=Cloeon dipterum TaxID=197152 RepID=A0A8S1D6N1_9INSE|nr:Hypothetical predicted protein [Cloeon dipterum]
MDASIRIYVAKTLQADRIRNIAADFGEKIPDDFQLDHLLGLPMELLKKIVVKLMEKKCDSLRRDEMDMNVLMLPALRLYLATRPRKADLTALLSFCPKRLKYQYLKKELSLVTTAEPEPFDRFFSATADDELLQALGSLKRLKVLRIEEICHIRLIDLIELCQNLPDLEYLHFNLDKDIDQIDFVKLNIAGKLKRAMPRLKVFLFDTSGQESAAHALIKCCAENLPNLRVIQDFSSVFSSFEDYESSKEISRPASGRSNLRHMLVDYDFVESCAHLPSAYLLITHLRIFWKHHANDAEEKNLTALLQLIHLESLEFIDVPQNILHLFVKKFGPNLRAISVRNHDDDVEMVEHSDESTACSLGQLLALCPKLERLAFRANFELDLEPIAFSSNLKEIKVEFGSNYNYRIPLFDILRAPNLEKILFHCCFFDLEELRTASTIIKEKNILRNLKELHFAFSLFNADYFKEIAAFIKCIAASLPIIEVISLGFFNGSIIGYEVLARSLAIGKTSNDEIDGLTEFFETQNVDIGEFVDEDLIAILQKYSR